MADKKQNLVEEALLQMKNLEEAVTENAKGILASTMKEEISELVKESLSEEEIEDEVSVEAMEGEKMEEGEEMEESMKHETKEQEELDIEDDMEVEDEDDMEDDSDEDEDDIEIDSDEMLMMDLPGDDLEVDDEEEILLPLDLTGASDEEILKVFKAMGEEDGIVVTQDGDEIHLKDEEADVEYQIQMEEFGGKKGDDSKSHKDYEESNEEYGGKKGDDSKSHKDYEESNEEYGGKKGDDSKSHKDYETNEGDEVVYEIEIGEDDGNYFGDAAEDDYSQIEKLKKDAHYDAERHHKDEHYEEYGGKKGDDSKSHKDYEETNEGGAKKGDQSKTRSDYKNFKDTDPNYHGKDGESHGDQGDHEADYEEAKEGMIRSHAVGSKASSEKSKGLPKPHSIPNKARYNESLEKEVRQLREKNEEYRKALNIFKEKLNEVAVFNSNLAYATRLFTEHSTTKQEKINILRRFDSADTIKESKGLYKIVKENLESKENSSVVTESVQSKVSKTPTKGSSNNLIESKTYENPQFLRMRDLMSKIK